MLRRKRRGIKPARIKACAMDGTKAIMRDVFVQQKLVSIILHGRKMMDSASKKRCTSELLPVAFSVPSTATTSFLRTPFVFPLPPRLTNVKYDILA